MFHTIVAALEDNGHQVAATDLYREQFDPAMSADERRSYYAARYDNTMVSAHTALLITDLRKFLDTSVSYLRPR